MSTENEVEEARPEVAIEVNTRIWDLLGKTDPTHTKKFTRSGGFKGTAIKPMWSNLRMTEVFGPCGLGWGQTEPQFQTVQAEGEILVYCTVGMWYMDNGNKCGPVYGVGGDKALTQIFEKDRDGNKSKDEATGRFKTYPQSDDEAFKKAYTDALSNAMKFIGIAADVHMGRFDDNKYVKSMEEFYAAPKPNPNAPKLISKQEAEALRGICNVAVSRGVDPKKIRETLQAEPFRFFGTSEVTEDKHAAVKAAIEAL